MIRIHEALQKDHPDTFVLATVHDSNLLEVPVHKVVEVGRLVQKIMREVGEQWFPEIPWVVDVEVGPDWGHITDLFE
jgi:DNA polymerase I-like protein with 3'-5' exonuclease and polymerase domains